MRLDGNGLKVAFGCGRVEYQFLGLSLEDNGITNYGIQASR